MKAKIYFAAAVLLSLLGLSEIAPAFVLKLACPQLERWGYRDTEEY